MEDLIAQDECPTEHEFERNSLTVASSPFRTSDNHGLLQTDSPMFAPRTEPGDSPVDPFCDPLSPDKVPSPQPDAIPESEMGYILTSKLSCHKQDDVRTGAAITSPCELDEKHFSAHFHPGEPGAMVLEKQLSSTIKHDSVQTACELETDQEQKEQSDMTGDMKVGSLSASVCQYSDKERNILEAPFSTDRARKEPQLVPKPDADNLIKFQLNSTIKAHHTTTRASPTNFGTVSESHPEEVSPSICGIIPVSSSPDEDALHRRRTNKGSRRPGRTGHVFASNQKVKVLTSADPHLYVFGNSVAGGRATNTKTWKALKTFDLVRRLAETSGVDRMAREDVDALYSVLSLTADAGITVAEKILGTERVDRIDEVIANSTRTFHTAYFSLVQTSVCATVREKITSFWSRNSVGRLITFISGWQAEKAQSLYHKAWRIHQDGGFKERFSSVSGRAELWSVPTFITFPILIAAYCVAHLLLLCHVVCLFLSGRACVKGGNKASVHTLHSFSSKAKFTSTAKPPLTQRLKGSKDGKVPLRGDKTMSKERETHVKIFSCEEGYTVKENDEGPSDDLVNLTRTNTKSPKRGMPTSKIDKDKVRTEGGRRNERTCADKSSMIPDSIKQESRDSSLQDSTTGSATSPFFGSGDLDSSGSSDITESPRKRIKLTPVRRMTAFLRKHGYQFKTRLVTPSSTPNIILYENLTLGQRLICLLRKIPVLAELLRDPRDPAPVVFLFGACSCVDNEKTRRILQMALPRAHSQCLKRKLDNVYPSETDTGDELWNRSDEELDGPNDDLPLTREVSSETLASESDENKGRDLRLSFTKRVESVSRKIPHPLSRSTEKTARSKASCQVLGTLRSSCAQERGDECSKSILSKTH